MIEQVVQIGPPSSSLAGIITTPEGTADHARPCWVLLNAGMVHRAGPGRINVRIARHLASQGYVVIRFDHSGIGDSVPRADGLHFEESSVEEVQRVMRHMREVHGSERFVLSGLCSGAATAFWAAGADDRVAGALLMNGRGHAEDQEWNEAVMNRLQARRYWKDALFQRESWRKALTGKIGYRRLARTLTRQLRSRVRPDQKVAEVNTQLADRFDALAKKNTHLLIVNSEGDHAIDYLNSMIGKQLPKLRASGTVRDETLSNADHTFTRPATQQRLLALIDDWNRQHFDLREPVRNGALQR